MATTSSSSSDFYSRTRTQSEDMLRLGRCQNRRLARSWKALPRLGRSQSTASKPSRVQSITSSFKDMNETKPLTKQDRFDPTVKYSVTKCQSCGVGLQETEPDGLGYFIEPTKSLKPNSSKRIDYFSAYSKIDEEGRKLLGFDETDGMFGSKKQLEEAEESEELICKRCHDAIHHSVFKIDEHKPLNFNQVMETVPINSNIFHVFSAVDFPLSLVNIKRRSRVIYVMNKCDMLFGHGSGVNKYNGFFKTMIQRLTGDDIRKMHLVSSYTRWGVPDLFKKLEPVNYLIGYVNTGKTRLSNMLANIAKVIRTPGAKLSKLQGSSHFPALTRDHIQHQVLNKTVVDVPGFLDEEGVFRHIQPAKLKSVVEGKKVLVSDLRDERYLTVKGGQCFTVGGSFFLIPPKDTILRVKPVVFGRPWVFTSLEKAKEVVSNPPEAMKDFIYVNPESADDLVRHVIPPFIGAIDLLIKDVGYVHITPTGSKKNEELFEVWAPRGVVLGVREAIDHFLTRYLKELKVKKRKLEHKGVVRIEKKEKLKMKAKPVPDYKIFSRLYQIPTDCTDPYYEMVAQFNKHLREEGGSYHQWSKENFRDETINKYWIEKV